MKYTGKLYGKVGRKYVPLVMTSDDVDKLQFERNKFRDALESILVKAVKRQSLGGDKLDFMDTLRECADIARHTIAKDEPK